MRGVEEQARGQAESIESSVSSLAVNGGDGSGNSVMRAEAATETRVRRERETGRSQAANDT